MNQNSSETFDEPDSVSDSQKEVQQNTPDSSDSAISQPQSSVTSPSENCSRSPHSSSDGKPNSTSQETPSVLNSQNCFVLRKSFMNEYGDSAGPSTKPNSTSDNVVSTTPKFQLKSSSFGSSLLKPSTLSTTSNLTSKGFSLKAPTLQNPFAKTANFDIGHSYSDDENKISNQSSEEVSSSEQVSSSPSKVAEPNSSASISNEIHPSSSSSIPSLSSSSSSHKFAPLLSSSTGVSSGISTTTATGGFVFGQNLRDRVTAVEEGTTNSELNVPNNNTEATSSSSNAFASANGTTDMLFTSVLQKEASESKLDSGGEDGGTTRHKSLSEAAREYEESRAAKRKYEEVTPVTGEEEECNVLQINCKLFLYDKVKTWIELGRGQLRLNDINNSMSRIVIRVSGSLRVILNTKIWAEMVVQKASDNSIRLTAKESGLVKVYLVKTSAKETDQLFKALEWRVNNQKKLVAENGDCGAPETKKVISESEAASVPVLSNGTSNSSATHAESVSEVVSTHSV